MRGTHVALAALATVVLGCSSSSKDASDAHHTGSGSDAGAPGDGTPADAPTTAADVTCATLSPLPTGTCAVTAGSTKSFVIEGNVVTPGTIFHGGQVAYGSLGAITCVGCNCAAGGETTITCPEATISPGLINTHDHITYTQNAPKAQLAERYDDRQQWREGLDQHTKQDPSGGASDDQIRWGELRFLMGGATSIVASGGVTGGVRNLDKSSEEGGVGLPSVYFDTFPLDDASGTRRTGDCNYGGSPETATQLAGETAYEPHTSEGIDATAHNEFLCESSASYDTTAPGTSNDLASPKTSMIHAVGLLAADYKLMASTGTGMVWSPRSNLSLYGDTARITVAARAGVNIALGTDWLPSGSMNLLRELACADSFNQTYLGGFFTDQQLWAMVTSSAAAVTKMQAKLGTLAPGYYADISVFASNGKTPFRAVLEAQPQDVALVMRGGTVLYGDDAVVAALASNCDAVNVCATDKRVCVTSEYGESYATLAAAVGSGAYPAFACGTPTHEPTCTPTRPTSVAGSTIYTGSASPADADGDGIPDASDDCPHVFDPIRPMDGSAQADADGDGMGDACDPCPLDASNTCPH